MIREMKTADLPAIGATWLAGNLDAHDFISPEYWKSNYAAVMEMFPRAEIFVYEEDATGRIEGFIGLSGDYVAGLFVAASARSRGLGKELLDHAKERRERLTLRVYQKNSRATAFYLREGFGIAGEERDEATGEPEYLMQWTRGAAPKRV